MKSLLLVSLVFLGNSAFARSVSEYLPEEVSLERDFAREVQMEVLKQTYSERAGFYLYDVQISVPVLLVLDRQEVKSGVVPVQARAWHYVDRIDPLAVAENKMRQIQELYEENLVEAVVLTTYEDDYSEVDVRKVPWWKTVFRQHPGDGEVDIPSFRGL